MTKNVEHKVLGGQRWKYEHFSVICCVPTVLGRNPSVRRAWFQSVEQLLKGTEQNPHKGAAFHLEFLCKVTSKQDQESLAGRGN